MCLQTQLLQHIGTGGILYGPSVGLTEQSQSTLATGASSEPASSPQMHTLQKPTLPCCTVGFHLLAAGFLLSSLQLLKRVYECRWDKYLTRNAHDSEANIAAEEALKAELEEKEGRSHRTSTEEHHPVDDFEARQLLPLWLRAAASKSTASESDASASAGTSEALLEELKRMATPQQAPDMSAGGQSANDDAPLIPYNESALTPLIPTAVMWLVAEAEEKLRNDTWLNLDLAISLSRLQSVAYCHFPNVQAWNCTRCPSLPLLPLIAWPPGSTAALSCPFCCFSRQFKHLLACSQRVTMPKSGLNTACCSKLMLGSIVLDCRAAEITVPCRRCHGKAANFQVERIVYDEGWDLFGYAGWDPRLQAMVVSFRGTDSHSIYNWAENMRYWRTDFKVPFPGSDGSKVHTGVAPPSSPSAGRPCMFNVHSTPAARPATCWSLNCGSCNCISGAHLCPF